MSKEKEEKGIDFMDKLLKGKSLSEDNLEQVSGGYYAGPCPECGGMCKFEPDRNREKCTQCSYSRGY